jgi:hypothetical protein
LSDDSLSDENKEVELRKLDRLLATRTVLMTESKSIMYTFKRRAYFTEQSTRNDMFDELNTIEPFK